MTMHIELIAFIAGLISSTAAIPQIVRMIRTRKTGAVSTYMFGMKVMSGGLWVAFGVATSVYSVIFWNAVSLLLCTTVIVMKYKIVRQKEGEKQAALLPTNVEKVDFGQVNMPELMPARPALRLVYSASTQA